MAIRKTFIAAALCTLGVIHSVWAGPQSTYEFNLPQQSLAEALRAIGRQTTMNILFEPGSVESMVAPAVQGTLSAEEAIRRVIAGKNLVVQEMAGNSVVVATVNSIGKLDGNGHLAGKSQRCSGLSSNKLDSVTSLNQTTSDSTAIGWTTLEGASDCSSENYQRNQRLASADAGVAGEPVQNSDGESSLEKDSTDSSQLEEVVVTAQKREEKLKDVPISVSALPSEELRDRNIVGLDGLSGVVPGLSLTSSGTHRYVAIRGISDFYGTAPMVGMYLDEASITSDDVASAIDVRTYDMERVEVLRGPQGTLYGDGSLGGTIRFITKNPVFNQSTMGADVTALYTQDGAPSQRADAVVNVPLINDKMALRIVGTSDLGGGWVDQPASDRKNINSQTLSSLRTKLLWEPTENLAINAMAVLYHNEHGTGRGEDADGNISQPFKLTTTPRVVEAYKIFNITATYDFAAMKLLSTSTSMNRRRDFYDGGNIIALFGGLYDQYYSRFINDEKTFNQEVRLMSTSNGPLQWTFGGSYKHIVPTAPFTQYFAQESPAGTPPPLPEPNIFPCCSSLDESWAVFANASYKLFDRMTLGAGLRYYEDRQKDTDLTTGLTQAGTFHSLSPRAYLQYAITRVTNVYVSAAKGFRSGGFNSYGLPAFNPESLWTYELGLKSDFIGGALTTNLAIYHSLYTGYQVFGLSEIGSNQIFYGTNNGGDVELDGFEYEVSWHISKEWTAKLNGDFMKSKFTKAPEQSEYQVGDSMALMPKYLFAASVIRDFTLFGRRASAEVDYNQRGKISYRFRNLGDFHGDSDPIHMLNFNINLNWNDSLSYRFFATNALNNRNLVDPFAPEGYASRSQPLTVGAGFSFNFN